MEWRRKGGLILDAGGVMAAAVSVRRDVVVCWFGQGLRHAMPLFGLYVTKMLHSLAFLGKCEVECG